MNRKDLLEYGETVEMLLREFGVNGRIVSGKPDEAFVRASEAALTLCGLARKLTAIAVADCNDGGGNARRDRRRERLEVAVYDLLLAINRASVDSGALCAFFKGDPRGYVLKLRLPSGRSNWVNGLWGIPPL